MRNASVEMSFLCDFIIHLSGDMYIIGAGFKLVEFHSFMFVDVLAWFGSLKRKLFMKTFKNLKT